MIRFILFVLILLKIASASLAMERIEKKYNSEFITHEEFEQDNTTTEQNITLDKAADNRIDNQGTKLNGYEIAKIIAVNKMTAKSSEILVKRNNNCYFGNIQIIVHSCFKNLNPYYLDSSALITILEHDVDEDEKKIFQGWINSKNLSISTLEHPVYEVFLKECL